MMNSFGYQDEGWTKKFAPPRGNWAVARISGMHDMASGTKRLALPSTAGGGASRREMPFDQAT
jgi:hypothetical protein